MDKMGKKFVHSFAKSGRDFRFAIHFPFLTEAYEQFSMRVGHLILRKIITFVATRCQIFKAKMHQNGFRISDPAGRAYSAPQTP